MLEFVPRCCAVAALFAAPAGFAQAAVIGSPSGPAEPDDTVLEAGFIYERGAQFFVRNEIAAGFRASSRPTATTTNGAAALIGETVRVTIAYDAATGLVTTTGLELDSDATNTTAGRTPDGPFDSIVLTSRYDNRTGSPVTDGMLDIDNVELSLDGGSAVPLFDDDFFDHSFAAGQNQFTFGTIESTSTPLSSVDFELSFDIFADFTGGNSPGSRVGFTAAFVPEPGTLVVLMAALPAVIARRRRP